MMRALVISLLVITASISAHAQTAYSLGDYSTDSDGMTGKF